MKTHIRRAGGTFKETGPNDETIIWAGELPLVDIACPLKVMDETKDNPVVYQVTDVMLHLGFEEPWQTIFVKPYRVENAAA